MNERRVRYVRTSDGQSIAYTVEGTGPPLVYMQPYSHQVLDWRQPEMASWYDALAAKRTLIRFDQRRFGLSERGDSEISVATLVLDLEAVAGTLRLNNFDLFGVSGLGFAAAEFAAAHPDRVNHLVLWATPPNGEHFRRAPRTRSLYAILEFDEDLATELQARYVFGDRVPLTPDRLEHTRETMRPSDLTAYLRACFDGNVAAAMAQIQCPTLIMYPREVSYIPSEPAQQVAALIQGSEFVQVDAGYYPYQAVDQAACISLLDDFLGSEASDSAAAPQGGFQTILFTDLEASTPLTQRLGDEGAQGLLRGHNTTVRGALNDHGGREIKHTGDGIMASFPSAVAAVTAALQIQRELAGGEVRVRVGLNAGEPIAEDDDLFGLSVIKAARVADRADPGQVLVSRVVMDLCEGKTFRFASLGEVQLKGFDDAIELFEVLA